MSRKREESASRYDKALLMNRLICRLNNNVGSELINYAPNSALTISAP